MDKILEIEEGPKGEIVIRIHSGKVFPPQAREHFCSASKETILGLYELFKSASKMAPSRSKRRPTKIDVQ